MTTKLSLQSFSTHTFYNIELSRESCITISTNSDKSSFNILKESTLFKIDDLEYISDEFTLIAIESVFSLFPKENFKILLDKHLFKDRNDLNEFTYESTITIPRASFSALANIWAKSNAIEEELITTGKVEHPKRPAYTSGELLYKKYFPSIDKNISFRVVDIERDLDNFHKWHNKEFIYEFWELNKTKDELKKYLEDAFKDAHSIPAILEFNNEPVGYFEFYWAKEDRLGPYFDFSNHDRGFHFLIGEENCLGRKNVDAILSATSHYAFLNDSRTELLAGEPRSDNKRIIRYVDHLECWRNEKEFDFPHKRAALLLCDRGLYFKEGYPWI